MDKKRDLSKLVKIAVLGAMAIILMMFEVPIIPSFPWLKFDISELPVLLGAFAFGPLAGVMIEVIKILLNLVFTGSVTGFVGELANFIMGVAFVLPASYIYHRNKSRKTAVIGMIVGTVCVNIAAIFANVYLLLPAFNMNLVGEALRAYIVGGLLPVNTLKAVVVSAITLVVYKKVSVAIFKVNPEEKKIDKKAMV